MIIGILKEARTGERRVAATPQTVTKLIGLGYDVVVDPGAGVEASFPDEAYVESGASIGDVSAADVVLGVNPPSSPQLDRVRPGATLIGMLSPALDADLVADLAERPITALAMDAVPRISRAQSMDVLSSMGSVAGYRAVLEASHQFGRFLTGQVTAAGKVPPTKLLVVGAGVAGLAAIGTARSLGAIVRATDPRPEVAEQVESLGGKYIAIESPEVEVSATGYAKEMGDDYKEREARLYAEQCEDVDIIITTALIPGRAAPRLIDATMVASMKSGSVIVDMAAANGGNVEGTVPGEVVRTDNGVILIGYTDLAGRMPAQSSQLYGTNVVNLLKLLTPDADGRLVLDDTDVVQRSIMVVRDGELTWPPPPVNVSAAPAAPASPAAGADAPAEVKAERPPASPATACCPARRCRYGLLPRRGTLATLAAGSPHGVRPRHRRGLLRHREGPPRVAHTADERHQRDLRDHRGRRPAPDRPRRQHRRHRHLVRRDPARQHQRLRRVRRHPAHARHVPEELKP